MYRHNLYVLERRFPDGTLDLRGIQPPPSPTRRFGLNLYWTEDELAKFYYRFNPDGPNVSRYVIRNWFRDEKGWTYRRVTWR